MSGADFVEATFGGDDGDGIGRLTVVAAANGFAGPGAAWFDRLNLRDFASRLSEYPLPIDTELSIDGGFGGENPQVHVALRAYPVGRRGQVAVGVDLATERRPSDRAAAQHAVHLELLTTYERLRAFSAALVDVIDGRAAVSRIEGEQLA